MLRFSVGDSLLWGEISSSDSVSGCDLRIWIRLGFGLGRYGYVMVNLYSIVMIYGSDTSSWS